MEFLSVIGIILILTAIALTIVAIVMAYDAFQSVRTRDFLEEYYKEEFGDEP